MTYLYAGLGIAMISGIAAMMQVGTNINSLIPLSVLKLDNYSNSSLAGYDRQIMKILYSQTVPDSDICNYVKNSISSPKYEDGEVFVSTGTQSPSTHTIFSENCALINKSNKHRVIITNSSNESYKYKMFSCYLESEPFCSFEINK